MRVVRIFPLTLSTLLLLTASAIAGTSYNDNNSTTTTTHPFATISRASAGNHLTSDARSRAWDMGANES